MKKIEIKRIESIEEYKSFKKFKWSDFNNNNDFKKVNILFGENGCGKTSIVNIFKSISQYDDEVFNNAKPKCVKIKINDKIYSYENEQWGELLDEGSILYFDSNFIAKNIHLGGSRDGSRDGQAQQSAKLIIEFDEKAIKLREEEYKLKQEYTDQYEKVKEYRLENKEILTSELTEDEEILFKKYKDYSDEEIKTRIQELDGEIRELDDKIKTYTKNLDRVSEISKIKLLNPIDEFISISDYEEYKHIFSYNIKEKTFRVQNMN